MNYTCYDCGSVYRWRHTPGCETAPPGSTMDLPSILGSHHWNGEEELVEIPSGDMCNAVDPATEAVR